MTEIDETNNIASLEIEVGDDCNGNGVPDAEDVALGGHYLYESETFSPFNRSAPITITLPDVPPANGDVAVIMWANTDLDRGDEYVDVLLNGMPVGVLFDGPYRQCPSSPHRDNDVLLIPADVFNAAYEEGITLQFVPSPTVDLCSGWAYVRVTYAAGAPDCNGNGIPDECDVASGTSVDCNGNGVPDECESVPLHFDGVVIGNTTGFEDICFVGPPEHLYRGIGGQTVTYALERGYIFNDVGPDFNVYEADSGRVEFNQIDVLVSADGIHFTSVKSSEGPVARIPGDEGHQDDAFARSYDLDAAGRQRAAFIRIDGVGDDPAGPIAGFDLDAIGIIHATSADANGNGVPDACDCPGDLDGDGDVDDTDLAMLLHNYATEGPVTYTMGDINGDGHVDLADLALLLSNYGNDCN